MKTKTNRPQRSTGAKSGRNKKTPPCYGGEKRDINAKWPLTAAFLYRLLLQSRVISVNSWYLTSFLTCAFCGFSMPFLLVFCFLHYVLFFSISGNCFMLGLNRISVRSSFLGYPVIFSRFHLKFVCKIIFNVHWIKVFANLCQYFLKPKSFCRIFYLYTGIIPFFV